jgi:hypothetical protein
VYERAVRDCVADGQAASTAVCHFRSPLQSPILNEQLCTDECRQRISQRTNAGH